MCGNPAGASQIVRRKKECARDGERNGVFLKSKKGKLKNGNLNRWQNLRGEPLLVQGVDFGNFGTEV
jgi:hypothetical protein